jgi:hypothetical protein
MFDSTSRYVNVPTTTAGITGSDGITRTVRYVQRRIIPPANDDLTVIEHIVEQGDRLDILAARYLGDPTLFWQICDENDALQPEALTERIGQIIKITLPL